MANTKKPAGKAQIQAATSPELQGTILDVATEDLPHREFETNRPDLVAVYCKRKGWTQGALCAELGISQAAFSPIKKSGFPNQRMLAIAVAVALDLSLEETNRFLQYAAGTSALDPKDPTDFGCIHILAQRKDMLQKYPMEEGEHLEDWICRVCSEAFRSTKDVQQYVNETVDAYCRRLGWDRNRLAKEVGLKRSELDFWISNRFSGGKEGPELALGVAVVLGLSVAETNQFLRLAAGAPPLDPNARPVDPNLLDQVRNSWTQRPDRAYLHVLLHREELFRRYPREKPLLSRAELISVWLRRIWREHSRKLLDEISQEPPEHLSADMIGGVGTTTFLHAAAGNPAEAAAFQSEHAAHGRKTAGKVNGFISLYITGSAVEDALLPSQKPLDPMSAEQSAFWISVQTSLGLRPDNEQRRREYFHRPRRVNGNAGLRREDLIWLAMLLRMNTRTVDDLLITGGFAELGINDSELFLFRAWDTLSVTRPDQLVLMDPNGLPTKTTAGDMFGWPEDEPDILDLPLYLLERTESLMKIRPEDRYRPDWFLTEPERRARRLWLRGRYLIAGLQAAELPQTGSLWNTASIILLDQGMPALERDPDFRAEDSKAAEVLSQFPAPQEKQDVIRLCTLLAPIYGVQFAPEDKNRSKKTKTEGSTH